jgi:hypothetical protein
VLSIEVHVITVFFMLFPIIFKMILETIKKILVL